MTDGKYLITDFHIKTSGLTFENVDFHEKQFVTTDTKIYKYWKSTKSNLGIGMSSVTILHDIYVRIL